MQTKTYECINYKCRLYEVSKDILLLDIFVNNKKNYIKKFFYYDNILKYKKYEKKYNYYYISEKLGYDSEEYYKKIDSIEINLNKIFNIPDFYIFTAGIVENIISVTLINKELLKEFTPQIDESKINLKWMLP